MSSTPSLQRIIQAVLRPYTLSVGAQGLVSGFHFALNLLLVRTIAPYDYGVFAFAFVLALFASALNNALIATPLTVFTPIIKDPEERTQQEGMFSMANLLLFATLVVVGLIYGITTHISTDITVAVTLFVAMYAARQYSRTQGYARLRPLVTASGDLAYVVTGTAIVLALLQWQGTLQVGTILYALIAANGAAMLVERIQLRGLSLDSFKLHGMSGYHTVWLQSRWALIGALTTLLMAQAHSLLITRFHGPDAFAPLAAGLVLFGPVRVALLTWQNMVKPEMAVALSDQQHAAVKAQIRRTAWRMGVAVVALAIILMLAWPWVHALLYAQQYGDQPMLEIVLSWSAITLFAALYNAPSAALQAMRDFKVLAMSSVYGAIISAILVGLLLFASTPDKTLFGILAAECFMALYLTRLVQRRLLPTPIESGRTNAPGESNQA